MNKVNLNEYIKEGLGEICSLIAHELMVYFRNSPSLSYRRVSNRSFQLNLKKDGLVHVRYDYSVAHDYWVVSVSKVKTFNMGKSEKLRASYISEGRFKNVSQLSDEIIKVVIS